MTRDFRKQGGFHPCPESSSFLITLHSRAASKYGKPALDLTCKPLSSTRALRAGGQLRSLPEHRSGCENQELLRSLNPGRTTLPRPWDGGTAQGVTQRRPPQTFIHCLAQGMLPHPTHTPTLSRISFWEQRAKLLSCSLPQAGKAPIWRKETPFLPAAAGQGKDPCSSGKLFSS